MLNLRGKRNASFDVEGLVVPFMALTVTAKSHKQLEETSHIYWQPEGSRELLCDVGQDEPFFASNLLYYPELPQPQHVGPYQTYRNWRIISKQQQQKQQQQRQQQKLQRKLNHHKLQQQMLQGQQQKQQDETQVSHVRRTQWLQAMERWNFRSSNRIPHHDAPLAREFPRPPIAWLQELKPELDWEPHVQQHFKPAMSLQPQSQQSNPIMCKPRQLIKSKPSHGAIKKRQHFFQNSLSTIMECPHLNLNPNPHSCKASRYYRKNTPLIR